MGAFLRHYRLRRVGVGAGHLLNEIDAAATRDSYCKQCGVHRLCGCREDVTDLDPAQRLATHEYRAPTPN